MDSNPLVTSSKTSEQTVQLHPLVLLTISDYVARHTLRQQTGPIIGAIIGTHHGRDITMEHAFECKLTNDSQSHAIQVDDEWFRDRLQQYRDVHKTQALDLVGWFTLAPTTGPQPQHLPVHRQLASGYNESILFLAFHPAPLLEESSKGDKLPVTIFEPVVEAGLDDGDKPMQASGESPATVLRFRELPYTIETGDAEMIGVDFVARGGANASAIPTTAQTESATLSKSKGKGKAKEKDEPTSTDASGSHLTEEEEDLIASMTTKANAIRMLKQRVVLIRKYLEALPPCYLNDASITSCEAHSQISHPILRSVSSLLARLPLLVPYTPASTKADGKASTASVYEQESAAQASEVALISLLGTMGSTLESAQSMSKKAVLVENANQSAMRSRGYGLDADHFSQEQSLPADLEARG